MVTGRCFSYLQWLFERQTDGGDESGGGVVFKERLCGERRVELWSVVETGNTSLRYRCGRMSDGMGVYSCGLDREVCVDGGGGVGRETLFTSITPCPSLYSPLSPPRASSVPLCPTPSLCSSVSSHLMLVVSLASSLQLFLPPITAPASPLLSLQTVQ